MVSIRRRVLCERPCGDGTKCLRLFHAGCGQPCAKYKHLPSAERTPQGPLRETLRGREMELN